MLKLERKRKKKKKKETKRKEKQYDNTRTTGTFITCHNRQKRDIKMKISYYAFAYDGTKPSAEAAIKRYEEERRVQGSSSSTSSIETSVSADRVLWELWHLFGDRSDNTSSSSSSSSNVSETLSLLSTSVGQKRPREEHEEEGAAPHQENSLLTAGGTLLASSSSSTSNTNTNRLFPYPPMRFEHLACLNLIVAAYAHIDKDLDNDKKNGPARDRVNGSSVTGGKSGISGSGGSSTEEKCNVESVNSLVSNNEDEVPKLSSTSASCGGRSRSLRFVGASAVVFCPTSGGRRDHEAYLQFLWVDPPYRTSNKSTSNKSGSSSSGHRIGSTLLEMALALGFGAGELSGACRRHQIVIKKPIDSIISTHINSNNYDDNETNKDNNDKKEEEKENNTQEVTYDVVDVPTITRFRLHTMAYRPLPQNLLKGNGVATSMLRSREEQLANFFLRTSFSSSNTTTATTKAPAVGEQCKHDYDDDRTNTALELVEIVNKLYASYGFVERRFVKGYYRVSLNAAEVSEKQSGGKDCKESSLSTPCNMPQRQQQPQHQREADGVSLLKTDAVELLLERRVMEGVLRRKQSKYGF